MNYTYHAPPPFLRPLKFRGMGFEQASVAHELFHIDNDRGVLEIAIAHPYFDNTEPPFRRNRDAVDPVHVGRVGREGIPAQQIGEAAPHRNDRFIGDLVGKASALAVLRVFPHGRDTRAHHKQHAIFDDIVGERFVHGDQLLYGADIGHDDFITV